VNWLFQHCDVSINEINVSATFMSFAIHSKYIRQKVNASNTACFLSKVFCETSETFKVFMTLKGGTSAVIFFRRIFVITLVWFLSTLVREEKKIK